MAPAWALFRREPAIALFLASGTLVFSVVGVVRSQVFLWIYLPALVASVAIVVWIDHSRGPIPGFLLWLLAIWAVMHLAGGLAANPTGETSILYGMWIVDGILRYDQLVHGFGIAAATAVLVTAARTTDRPLLWGFFWAQVIGVVNETAENVFAHFVEESNVGDAVNTAWDLGWHVIGGLVAVAIIAYRGIPAVEEAPA
jgi:hypothetical protein